MGMIVEIRPSNDLSAGANGPPSFDHCRLEEKKAPILEVRR